MSAAQRIAAPTRAASLALFGLILHRGEVHLRVHGSDAAGHVLAVACTSSGVELGGPEVDVDPAAFPQLARVLAILAAAKR